MDQSYFCLHFAIPYVANVPWQETPCKAFQKWWVVQNQSCDWENRSVNRLRWCGWKAGGFVVGNLTGGGSCGRLFNPLKRHETRFWRKPIFDANHAQQGNGRIKGRNLSGCSRFDQFWYRLIWLEQRNTFWLLLDSVMLTFHWMFQPFVTGWAWKVRSVSPLVSEIAWDSLRYLGDTVSSWVFGCKFLTTDQKSIRISRPPGQKS